jgi:hypothetical protein
MEATQSTTFTTSERGNANGMTLSEALKNPALANNPLLRLATRCTVVSDATHLLNELSAHCGLFKKFSRSPAPVTQLTQLPQLQSYDSFNTFLNLICSRFHNLTVVSDKRTLPPSEKDLIEENIQTSLKYFANTGAILLDAAQGIDIAPRTMALEPATYDQKISALQQAHLFQGLELLRLGAMVTESTILRGIVPDCKTLINLRKLTENDRQKTIDELRKHANSKYVEELRALAEGGAETTQAVVNAGGVPFSLDQSVTSSFKADVAQVSQYAKTLLSGLDGVFAAINEPTPDIKKIVKRVFSELTRTAEQLNDSGRTHPLLEVLAPLHGPTLLTRDDLRISASLGSRLPIHQILFLKAFLAINLTAPILDILIEYETNKLSGTTTEEKPEEGTSTANAETAPSAKTATVTESQDFEVPKNGAPAESLIRHLKPPVKPPRSTPVYSSNPYRGVVGRDPRIVTRLEKLREEQQSSLRQQEQDRELDNAIAADLGNTTLFTKLFPQGSAKGQFASVGEWKDYCAFITSTLLNVPISEVTTAQTASLLEIHPHLVHKQRRAGELSPEIIALCTQVEKLRTELLEFHSFYDHNDKRSPLRVNASVLPPRTHPKLDPLKNPEAFQSAKSIRELRKEIVHPTDVHYKEIIKLGIDPVPIMIATEKLAEIIFNEYRHEGLRSVIDAVVSHTSQALTTLRVPSETERTQFYLASLKEYAKKHPEEPGKTDEHLLLEARTLAAAQNDKFAALERSQEGLAREVSSRCCAAYIVNKDARRIELRDKICDVQDEKERAIATHIHAIIRCKLYERDVKLQQESITTEQRQMTRGTAREPRWAKKAGITPITIKLPEES